MSEKQRIQNKPEPPQVSVQYSDSVKEIIAVVIGMPREKARIKIEEILEKSAKEQVKKTSIDFAKNCVDMGYKRIDEKLFNEFKV